MIDCKLCDGTGYKDHAGFSMDQCDHKKKSSWEEQWDGCDVCELCGQLTTGNRLLGRASLAITFLYTHGILTERERDAARKRIFEMKQND